MDKYVKYGGVSPPVYKNAKQMRELKLEFPDPNGIRRAPIWRLNKYDYTDEMIAKIAFNDLLEKYGGDFIKGNIIPKGIMPFVKSVKH
jgi:hypothetical protein